MSIFRHLYNQTLERTDIDRDVLFCDESLVVIAGPGSGKTQLLTLKMAYILENMKNTPRGVACLTYSRRLAKELKDKLFRVGVLPERNVFIGTLHSFCLANIVSLYANFHDYKINLPIRIASQKDCKDYWQIAKKKAEIAGVNTDEIIKFRNKDFLESRVFQEISEKDLNPQSYVKAIGYYESFLMGNRVLDFDLLIRASIQLVHKHEYAKHIMSARFKWLLIDEYQDLGYPLHLFSKIWRIKVILKFYKQFLHQSIFTT